jgi:DNA-binding MarR family transcriptional regulator
MDELSNAQDVRVIAQLELVLGQLSEVFEEIYERKILASMLGDADEVSTAQFRTLAFLSSIADDQPGFLVGQIAQGLRISYPAATKAVDRLAERHLAQRHKDQTDARTIQVKLTTKGRELVEKLGLERRAALTRVIQVMGGTQSAHDMVFLLENFMAKSLEQKS